MTCWCDCPVTQGSSHTSPTRCDTHANCAPTHTTPPFEPQHLHNMTQTQHNRQQQQQQCRKHTNSVSMLPAVIRFIFALLDWTCFTMASFCFTASIALLTSPRSVSRSVAYSCLMRTIPAFSLRVASSLALSCAFNS